jgi:hypothetical protein
MRIRMIGMDLYILRVVDRRSPLSFWFLLQTFAFVTHFNSFPLTSALRLYYWSYNTPCYPHKFDAEVVTRHSHLVGCLTMLAKLKMHVVTLSVTRRLTIGVVPPFFAWRLILHHPQTICQRS